MEIVIFITNYYLFLNHSTSNLRPPGCRNISLKTVKNALSFARRRSGGSEEQNLLGSSQETDRDTEDETGGESQEETDRGLARLRDRERDSVGSGFSDNLSSAPLVGKRKSKRSNK